MRSIDPSFLPPLVRFFLDVCNEDNSLEILKCLRIAFTDFLAACVGAEGAERQKLASINTLLLGILKNSFLSRWKLFDTFYKDMMSLCTKEMGGKNENKAVEADDYDINIDGHDYMEGGAKRIQIIDLWVLYAVSGSQQLMTKLHTLVAKLWQAKALGTRLLHESMHEYANPLMDYFPSILALAQSTIASTRMGGLGVSAQQFGLHLYTQLYEEFPAGKRCNPITAHFITSLLSTGYIKSILCFFPLTHHLICTLFTCNRSCM